MPPPVSRRAPMRRLDVTRVIFIAFLAWSGLVALLWATGLDMASASGWVEQRFATPAERAQGLRTPLQEALPTIFLLIDRAWFFLALAAVYLSVAAGQGVAVARRWLLLLLAGAAGMSAWLAWGWSGVWLQYGLTLGPKAGPIPLAWVFFWCAAFLGARALARLTFPTLSHAALAPVTALMMAALHFNFEPVAAHLLRFWRWAPTPRPAPWWSFAAWFALALVLAFLLRAPQVLERSRKAELRAAVVFLVIHLVLLLTQAGYFLRQ